MPYIQLDLGMTSTGWGQVVEWSVCPLRGVGMVCVSTQGGGQGLCVPLLGAHMALRKLSYSLNGLPSDLRHDGTLSPKVLIAQAQEVVDDKGCGKSRAEYPGQQSAHSQRSSKPRAEPQRHSTLQSSNDI